MAVVNQILVPTDFSACSDAALDYATMLAATFRAPVAIVHVFEDPFVAAAYSEAYAALPPDMRASMLREIETRLAERRRRAEHRGVTTVTEVLTGRTSRVIAEYAAAHATDLIVMGTHGRTGLGHLLVGSVAERVVREAPCPVLTVRQSPVVETLPESVAAVAGA